MPFPLPLVPFEYYYWSDDRPEYPTVFPVELVFSGTPNQELFRAALDTALARHPLLRASIDDSDPGKPVWVSADGLNPFLDWASEETPIGHTDGERIDLRRCAGLRVWVRQAAVTTRVVFEFHHACCDGLAAVGFIQDLLVAYSLAAGGAAPGVRLRRLDAARLKARGEFGVGLSTRRASARELWRLARTWQDILLRQPAALAAPTPSAGDRETCQPFLHFETRPLDLSTARKLREVARAEGVTLNDLLLGDLFGVLSAWNREHDPAAADRPLRINMPTSLRSREDVLMPAANGLSFAFLGRKPGECDEGRHLLASIHAETEQIKRRRLGLYFVGGIAFARRVPGLVPWLLRRRRCFATAVLSNMGRVLGRTGLRSRGRRLICGDMVLERIDGVPPVRFLSRASFAVHSYAGQTTVNLRCDPACFSVEQTRRLLAAYVAKLDQTADGAK